MFGRLEPREPGLAGRRAMAGRDGPVILLRGEKFKARYNGKTAIITKKGTHGWVTVRITESDPLCVMKWRTGHWTTEKAHLMSELPGDTWLLVAQQLSFADKCAMLQVAPWVTAMLRSIPLFADVVLRNLRMLGMGSRDAISCGPVESKQIRFISFLGCSHQSVGSLDIELGCYERDAVRYLLQAANTSHLTTATIRVTGAKLSHLSNSFDYAGKSIDLTEVRYLSQATLPPIFSELLSSRIAPGTAHTIEGVLAQHCPVLTHLSLQSIVDVRSLCRLTSLVKLDADFRLLANVVEDVRQVASSLPTLSHLVIRSIRICRVRLVLESRSLQVVETSCQGCSFERIDCPNLQELKFGCICPCKGNGLLLCYERHDGTLKMFDGASIVTDPTVFVKLACFGPMGDVEDCCTPGPLITLPDGCVVSWQHTGFANRWSFSSVDETDDLPIGFRMRANVTTVAEVQATYGTGLQQDAEESDGEG